MKIYQLVIFITIVIYTLNSCLDTFNIHKSKDCTTKILDYHEKLLGFKYCCFLDGYSENIQKKRCIGLNQTQYDNIEETIKWVEEIYAINVKNLTC